jgi:ActR/RegA family two-component response regulator
MRRPPRYLVVLEDDAAMLRSWVRTAKRQNVPVVPCSTVDEAMEALTGSGAAGLITDFHLEAGTSLPAIGLARRLAPPLPVSVATGNGDRAAEALEAEGLAAEVQSKPVDMADVLDRVWQRRSQLP